jgi:two-component system nitrate/nitrite response regulator NarL
MATVHQVWRPVNDTDRLNSLLTVVKPQEENLRVVLVLHNQVERLGVEQMLRSVAVVDSCRSHEDFAKAVTEAVRHESTVLIAALRDIDQMGRSLLGTATRQGVKLLILIDDDFANLRRLVGIRISGFASISDLSATSLHITLQRIRDGEMPMSPQVAQFLVSLAEVDHGIGPSRARVRMTSREQEVLVLLVDGLSNKQIARRLGVSVHGAKRHVANVLAKLDCPNRTLAVAKALREGLYEEYLKQ